MKGRRECEGGGESEILEGGGESVKGRRECEGGWGNGEERV